MVPPGLSAAWDRHRTAFLLLLAVMLTALGVIFDREWLRDEVFSPADLLAQFQPWAADGPRATGSNPTRSDEAFYHQPLMTTHFERLRDGALPDLDPTRLSGVPSFFQGLDTGRLLSPFSLPFYLMPADDAVSAYGPLRLLVAAICMWALLRGVGLSSAAAALGGAAYGLNGHFLVWLSAPMPTVAAWLPLGLLFVHRMVDAPGVRPAAGLAFAVGLMATGAYLATFMACLAALGVHAAVVVGLSRRWQTLPWLAGGLCAGLLLGAGALLPMLTALLTSPAAARVVSAEGAQWANVATLAMHDFWGTPLLSNWWHPDPTASYPEHVAYFGVAVMGLAGAAAAALVTGRLPDRWRAVSCSAALLLCVALTRAYGVPPGRWLVWLPGQAQTNPFRWYVVAALALAVLAAVGLCVLRQAAERPGAPAGRGAWVPVLGVAVALALLAGGAAAALVAMLPDIRAANLQAFEKGQLTRFGTVAGTTLLLAALTAHARAVTVRRAALWLLVVVAAADLALANRHFNPTVPRERYYPETRGLAWLAEHALGARIAPVDADAELVEGHVWSMYGLNTVTGYDFHGDADYQRLLWAAQRQADDSALRNPPTAAWSVPPTTWGFVGLRTPTLDLKLLGLLGTRFVVTSPVDVLPRGGGYAALGELLPGQPVTFRFVPRFDGLRRIDILAATYARRNTGSIRITLTNARGVTLATRDVAADDWPDNDWLTLTLPPAFPSAGEPFEVHLHATGTAPGAAPTVWTTDGSAAASGLTGTALSGGGTPIDRVLWMRAFSTAPERVPGADLAYAGDLNAYRNPYARPPAWFVSRVTTAAADAHLSGMQTSSFDPALDAWVAGATAPLQATTTARVTSVGYDDDRRTVRVEAPDGGVLILGERAHSGWRVEIDGRPAPWLVANSVLMAVQVPPGARVVTATFEQPWLRPALGLSAAAFVGIVFAAVFSARRHVVARSLEAPPRRRG